MTAKASGNTASSPPPPRISQVSLKSQTGATEAIIRSRSCASGRNPNSMPTPRSKPSRSTYMKTASARIAAHSGTRSSAMAGSLRVGGGRQRTSRARFDLLVVLARQRRLRSAHDHAPQQHEAAAEDDDVGDDVGGQRQRDVAGRQRRRH